MKSTKIAEREFDEWVELAKQDPSTFEQLRLAAINEVIDSAPAGQRERLTRLQWRIDQERRLARTPMNACIRISRMMWDNLVGRGGLSDRFSELDGLLRGTAGAAAPSTEDSSPRVLDFARPGRSA
jgi:hypothetical protein